MPRRHCEERSDEAISAILSDPVEMAKQSRQNAFKHQSGGTSHAQRRNPVQNRLTALGMAFLAAAWAVAASSGAANAQAPAANAGPVQPWGLPPLPQGVGPVEKFADLGDTPQGKFLEGGAFDNDGNLWFVAIGSGWVSYLTPDGKLAPAVNCNPPPEIGQTCEPQGTRWHDGKLYVPTRHRGILTYDPKTKK